MNLSDRLLSRTAVASIIIGLISFYGYANSMVSYKYEVEDTVFAHQALDERQQSILTDITSTKYVAITCLILFCFIVFISISEPTFNGKVTYKKK
jgi:hypothetical protein